MRIVVIGSIAAGVSAAQQISGGDGSARITVYEKGAFYSCGVDGLPYYLAESTETLNEAVMKKESELASAGIDARLLHEVTGIDPVRHTLRVKELTTGREFEDNYDRLVIAVGSSNIIPAVPGCDRIGVHTLKSVEELIFIKEFIRSPYVRDIVILGASWSGLEIAKAFLKTGRHVRIIDSSRQLLPEFDPEISNLIRQQLELEGVMFSLGEKVRSFPGRTFVEQVQTDRNSYSCDLCIAADAAVPNTSVLRGTGIETDSKGRIAVNRMLETNVKDIYAVGDCSVCREGTLNTCSIRVGNTEIAVTGLSESAAKAAGIRVKCAVAQGQDRPGICPNPKSISIKLVCEAGTGRIIGAQAWGGKNVATRINAVAVAISAGMTARQLACTDFCFSSSRCTIWDPIQLVCGQIK
ncbi:MAG: FAD-dependent oxidoreductase [Eubacteriales bacterium]|nr:FAD-dependent oxidoreductase [Eubacteriales bacterium]